MKTLYLNVRQTSRRRTTLSKTADLTMKVCVPIDGNELKRVLEAKSHADVDLIYGKRNGTMFVYADNTRVTGRDSKWGEGTILLEWKASRSSLLKQLQAIGDSNGRN